MILSSKRNNKGADQPAHLRRLVCAFVVRKLPKTGFAATSFVVEAVNGTPAHSHML